MKILKKYLVTASLLITVCTPATVMADSDSTDTAPFSVQANLDFQITIPGSLSFQVGSAGAIDQIDFAPALANLGNNTDVAGTGGNVGGGVVDVVLFSNVGQITITPSNNSSGNGLDNGQGDHIPYTEIITTSSDDAILPEPALNDAGGIAVLVPTTAGLGDRVTDLAETWTYTYDNTTVYGEGIYGGSGKGGRVTYTAAAL